VIEKTDPQIVKELAREAEGLRNNRAFAVAVAALQKQFYGELLDPKTDDEGMKRLRAQLMALEAIPRMLDSLIASQTIAQRGQLRA
jgi:phage tail sheath gpL-like